MAHHHKWWWAIHYDQVAGMCSMSYNRPLLGRDTVRERGLFKLVVETFIDAGTAWKLSFFFRISPICCLTRTSSYGTKFVRTHTLNSKWLDLKGDTMLSVYWTPLRHYLTSRACCATRVTLQFGGALCNEGAVYYLCILWQCMGIWIILVFI